MAPSLADRITMPSEDKKVDWSEDIASPVGAKMDSMTLGDPKPEPKAEPEKEKEKENIPQVDGAKDTGGQVDGATEFLGGSGINEPEFDVEVKLIDETNPLYSISQFEDLGLAPEILNGMHAMRFKRPSKIQEKALPLLMANPPTNMIGQSQSGTGKTAAFVLNILHRLDLSTPETQRTPQALVLAPTRELARQIQGVIQIMGKFVDNLHVMAAVPMDASERGKRFECSVVVGTAGTTFDMIKRRLLDTRAVKVLVLDEADNMLDQQGMGEQCLRVKKQLPNTTQVVLFSATFPDQVLTYAQKFAPRANMITLKHEELTVEGIKQLYLDCDGENDKYDVLIKLYGLMTVGSSVIFVRKKVTAEELERRLTAEGHQVVYLHGGLDGAVRDTIIDSFRNGLSKVLITTNVLARGIDVQTVSMVVNYDVPVDPKGKADPQTYLHRIGRTGRFGRVGVSITFVYDHSSWESLMKIQQYFQCQMTRINTRDWDEVEGIIKRVIKSSRAAPDFQPEVGGPGGMASNTGGYAAVESKYSAQAQGDAWQ